MKFFDPLDERGVFFEHYLILIYSREINNKKYSKQKKVFEANHLVSMVKVNRYIACIIVLDFTCSRSQIFGMSASTQYQSTSLLPLSVAHIQT